MHATQPRDPPKPFQNDPIALQWPCHCFANGGSMARVIALTRLLRELRAEGITDRRVLADISKIPRDLFVPADCRHHAYRNIPLPIGHGQTISQPYVVALMTQALRLKG